MASYSRPLTIIVFIILSAALWQVLEGYTYRFLFCAIPLLLAAQITLADALEDLLTSRLRYGTKWFTLLIAPGTILHELCHLLTALATGCTVTKAALFRPNPATGVLGFVNYTQPDDKWTVLREFIVGFAPFFGCGIVLLLFNSYFGGSISSLIDDSPITDVSQAWGFAQSVASSVFSSFTRMDYGGFAAWVIVYLQLCFTVGAAPSSTDFKGAFSSLYKHLISSAVFIALVAAIIFASQRQIPLWGHEAQVASYAGVILKFAVTIMLMSITLIAGMMPLAYLGFKVSEISGIAKTIPVTSAALVFYFVNKSYGLKYAAIAAAATLAATMIILTVSDSQKPPEEKKPKK